MYKLVIVILLSLMLLWLFSRFRTGYSHRFGNWYWVTVDEQFGKRTNVIAEADNTSFEVMENKEFAKDVNNVYYKGKKVNHVNASKVEFLGGAKSFYFKDDKYVYCTSERILTADPATFVIIEFPYSKDKNDVYCGTVPMKLSQEELQSFRVTNEDKWTKNTICSGSKTHFIEYNPQYAWLDTLGIEFETVVTGDYGTAETTNKKFIGLRELKTKEKY